MKKQTHAPNDRRWQTVSNYKNAHTLHNPPSLHLLLVPSQKHLHIQQHLSLDHGSSILRSLCSTLRPDCIFHGMAAFT